MKETTAYAIVKELKSAGYPVCLKDAPPRRPPRVRAEEDDLAVVGAPGMPHAAVKACASACRKAVLATRDAYAIDTSGKCGHYPRAAFAAW